MKADSSEEEEKIILKCLEENDLTIEEFKEFRSDTATEKMMCFLKCKYEHEGSFDENGVLIKEIVQESYDDLGWTDEQRAKSDVCLDNMKPVKKCGDFKEFFDCIPVVNFKEVME